MTLFRNPIDIEKSYRESDLYFLICCRNLSAEKNEPKKIGGPHAFFRVTAPDRTRILCIKSMARELVVLTLEEVVPCVCGFGCVYIMFYSSIRTKRNFTSTSKNLNGYVNRHLSVL